MEDILKFQRIQSAFDSLFAQSSITASALLGNYLVLGTNTGEVYILLLSGNQKQRFRAFEGKEVTSLSLTINGHLSILCTGRDDDAVVICGCYQEDLRLSTIRFSESVTVVCYNSKGRDGSANSFLVGTLSGKVLLYRTNFLLGKKELVLQDNNSRNSGCITALAWRGDLAAWADGSGVAVFDVSTMAAVARIVLGPPINNDLSSSTPVSAGALSSVLCWMSERRLLLAWGCAVRCYAVRSAAEEGLADPHHQRSGSSSQRSSSQPQSQSSNQQQQLVLRQESGWDADCGLILGLLPFDVDHVALLGLSLTGGSSTSSAADYNKSNSHGNNSSEDDWSWEVEVIVAERISGTFISADVLPLRGLYTSPANLTIAAIRGFNLLAASAHSQSTQSTSSRQQLLQQSSTAAELSQQPQGSSQWQQVPQPQSSQWKLRAMEGQRGGDRGLAPLLLVTAPCDLILCRVRDVNDRVRAALELKDLKLAAETAARDRAALRVYPFADLLQAYLTQLMDTDEIETAASEAARLIQRDSVLWESWLYRFLQAGRLDALVPHLPVDRPRLERYLYDEALDDLVDHHPYMLLSTVKLWTSSSSSNNGQQSQASPIPVVPCFDVAGLLERIKRRLAVSTTTTPTPPPPPPPPPTSNNHASQQHDEDQNDDYRAGINDGEKPTISSSTNRSTATTQLLETAAYLHLLRREYEEALSCYLSMPLPPSSLSSSSFSEKHGNNGLLEQDLLLLASSALGNSQQQQQGYEHRQVFDLIERQAQQSNHNKESSSSSLFRLVESKIANLVRLSRPLAARLLLNHMDGRLPIRSVATQIQRAGDDNLLLWYLHQLFTDTAALEVYRNPALFADLHLCQLRLYIKRVVLSTTNNAASNAVAVEMIKKQLLSFVREGLVPDQIALQELEQQAATAANANTVEDSSSSSPLLYQERVILLARLGRSQQALQLLMAELGSAAASLSFITGRSSIDEQRLLWEDLTAFALQQPSFLAELLDSLGSAACLGLDAASLLRRLPEHYTHLPQLRSRIAKALTELRGQEALLRQGRSLLAEDALATLLLKNQRQRKALKIMPTASNSQSFIVGSSLQQQQGSDRCLLCRRPLVVSTSVAQAMTAMGITTSSTDDSYKSTAPLLSFSSSVWTQRQLWGAACFPQQQQGKGLLSSTSESMMMGEKQHSSGAGGGGSLPGIIFISGKVATHHSCFDIVCRLQQQQSPPAQQQMMTTDNNNNNTATGVIAVSRGAPAAPESAAASDSRRQGRRMVQPPIR